jgi:hypothetical protein
MDQRGIIQLVIAWTLTGALIITVIITFLSLLGRTRIEPEERKKLFYVLVVEVVVVSVGFFGDFLEFNPSAVRTTIASDAVKETFTGENQPRGETEERAQFCFYMPNPPPGWRKMVKRSNTGWEETQPNNIIYQHRVLARISAGPWPGTIIQRIENPKGEPYPVQLFIPDKGTAFTNILFRPDSLGYWKAVSTVEDDMSNCPRPSKSAASRSSKTGPRGQ